MKKIKHSKFKNTGFIFELLVRQVTSEIMSSEKSTAEKILKEFFNSKKELSKELKLYQYLINEKYNSETKTFNTLPNLGIVNKSISFLYIV